MKIELTQSPLAIGPWRKERGREDGPVVPGTPGQIDLPVGRCERARREGVRPRGASEPDPGAPSGPTRFLESLRPPRQAGTYPARAEGSSKVAERGEWGFLALGGGGSLLPWERKPAL